MTLNQTEHSSDAPLPQPNMKHSTTVSLPTVFHVGNLERDRTKPYISNEGMELSVSVHPRVWKQIMQGGGTPESEPTYTYELSHADAEFYLVDPTDPLDTERQWCLDNGYVTEVNGYRVTYETGDGETAYMEFGDETKANTEADERHGEVESVSILELAANGVEYWESAFRQSPNAAGSITIKGLLPIWYAKQAGYDGVWWDEQLAPQKFSAPRGAIFQEKLDQFSRDVIDID